MHNADLAQRATRLRTTEFLTQKTGDSGSGTKMARFGHFAVKTLPEMFEDFLSVNRMLADLLEEHRFQEHPNRELLHPMSSSTPQSRIAAGQST